MMSRHADGVQELYEEYPYPAHGIVSSVIATMARNTIAELRSRVSGRQLLGLDAGCGTGEQALGLARAFPDLQMTGIDFSEASLEFARRLAQRHGLSVKFERKDLTRPFEDLGRFDFIACVGALHHLPDPCQGLRTLRGIAQPRAILLGMVYGTFGKWDLFRIRDALNLLAGSHASREERLGILSSERMANNAGPAAYFQALKRRFRFGPRIAWREAAARVLKGRSANYQADAYTHPRETSYTWAELDRTLAETGWRLVGWPQKSGMPDDPRQLFKGPAAQRLAQMSLLERAAVYERILCPPHLYFLAEPAGAG